MKKILILLLLCSNLSAITTSKAISEIRLLINDNNTDTTNRRYSDSVLLDRINLAQIDIVKKTACLESTEYITTSTNTYEYSCSTDTIKSLRLYFNLSQSTSIFKKLEMTTQDDLDKDILDWQTKPAGYPQKWFKRQNSIYVYPKVAGIYSNYKLRHDYIKYAVPLTSTSSTLFDGLTYLEPYHQLVIWYVTALCMADQSNNLEGESYYKKYLDDIILLIKDKENK